MLWKYSILSALIFGFSLWNLTVRCCVTVISCLNEGRKVRRNLCGFLGWVLCCFAELGINGCASLVRMLHCTGKWRNERLFLCFYVKAGYCVWLEPRCFFRQFWARWLHFGGGEDIFPVRNFRQKRCRHALVIHVAAEVSHAVAYNQILGVKRRIVAPDLFENPLCNGDGRGFVFYDYQGFSAFGRIDDGVATPCDSSYI